MGTSGPSGLGGWFPPRGNAGRGVLVLQALGESFSPWPGFGLSLATRGAGPVPLQYDWSHKLAGQWAATLKPPSAKVVLSQVQKEGLLPKEIKPKEEFFTEKGWEVVLGRLLMQELATP